MKEAGHQRGAKYSGFSAESHLHANPEAKQSPLSSDVLVRCACHRAIRCVICACGLLIYIYYCLAIWADVPLRFFLSLSLWLITTRSFIATYLYVLLLSVRWMGLLGGELDFYAGDAGGGV